MEGGREGRMEGRMEGRSEEGCSNQASSFERFSGSVKSCRH